MKLTREFSPVKITLETAEDLETLMAIIGEVAYRSGPRFCASKLNEKADNLYRKLAALNGS